MKELLTIASMLAVSLSAAAESQFILDIDDALHVKFETGAYAAVYQEVELQNGPNTITVSDMEDFVLTPKAGWLIESITAYDESGAVDESAREWTFNSNDDSYKIYFFMSETPAYRYEVKTKINDMKMNSLTLTIDNPDAVLNGFFKVGNQNVTPLAGVQTIEYNPDKGVGFYMELRPAVTDVAFLRNGVATEPTDVYSDGSRTFSFDLVEDHETIEITTVMEDQFYFLDIDDPTHVNVFYPDKDTSIENLTAGSNCLEFNYGDMLYVSAKEGYRIKGLDNMNFNSRTDVYFYEFRDGDSGVMFKCTTEEYVAPTCTFTVNVDNTDYVVTATGGLNDDRVPGEPLLKAGNNEYLINLDKVSEITLEYSYRFDGKLIGSYNGEAFTIEEPENMWYCASTTFKDFVPGEAYRVVIRQKIEGIYNESGEVTFVPSNDYSEWVVSFNPGGIIEITAGIELPSIIQNANGREVTAYVGDSQCEPEIVLVENDVVIRFAKPLGDGDYTLSIPSGLFKVNNAPVDKLTHVFSVVGSGIVSICPDTDSDTEYLTLQGERVLRPQAGQLLIVKRGDKVSKEIVK